MTTIGVRSLVGVNNLFLYPPTIKVYLFMMSLYRMIYLKFHSSIVSGPMMEHEGWRMKRTYSGEVPILKWQNISEGLKNGCEKREWTLPWTMVILPYEVKWHEGTVRQQGNLYHFYFNFLNVLFLLSSNTPLLSEQEQCRNTPNNRLLSLLDLHLQWSTKTVEIVSTGNVSILGENREKWVLTDYTLTLILFLVELPEFTSSD